MTDTTTKLIESRVKLKYDDQKDYSSIWFSVHEMVNKDGIEIEFIRLLLGIEHLMCDYPEETTHLELDIDDFGIIYDLKSINMKGVLAGKGYLSLEEENDLILSLIDSKEKASFSMIDLTAKEIKLLLKFAKFAHRQHINDPTFEWEA